MTVSNQDVHWDYTRDGTTTNYGFDNVIYAASDLEVYVDGVLKTVVTDYSVTGLAVPTGGNVVFVGGGSAGQKVRIVSAIPATQGTSFPLDGSFPSTAAEQAYDRLTRLMQQGFFRISRSLALADGDGSAALAALPVLAGRANKLLGFDGQGNPEALNPSDASSTAVLAIGSTTSRMLADRFAEVYNVLDFGATGDSTTDDAPAIQAAIDAARSTAGAVTKIVRIPTPARQVNGNNGHYVLGVPLRWYSGTAIVGEDLLATQLYFANDTDGFLPNDPTAISSFVHLENLRIRGNAPASLSATKTVGLKTIATSFSTFHNLYIDGWVDGLKRDASNIGYGENDFDAVYIDQGYFPNPTNGGPRYGLWDTGSGGFKPQSNHFRGWIYSTIMAGGWTVGDGATTSFDIDLGAGNKLWQHSGIKVKLTVASGAGYPRKSLAAPADYSLYNRDTGSSVLIAPGSTNVGARHLRVVFVSAPAASAARIIWNDPWGATAIQVDAGNQNTFDGTISGYQTGIVDSGGLNDYRVQSSQIVNLMTQAQAGASRSDFSRVRVIDNETIDQWWSLNAGATNIGVVPNAGKDWTEIKMSGGDATITSGSFAALTFDGAATSLDFIEISGGHREVQFEADFTLLNSAGASAQADIQVSVSYDNKNSWGVLGGGFTRLEINIGGATSVKQSGALNINCRDTTNTVPGGTLAGTFAKVCYKVEAKLNSGTSLTIGGGGQTAAALRVRNVQPQ